MQPQSRSPEPLTPSTPAELLRVLGDRIGALDRTGAVTVALDAVAEKRIEVADLYTQVLGVYLAAVGSRWQHGTQRVWQEHFASHVVRTIIEALSPTVTLLAAEAPLKGQTVLLACPPDEQHDLGLRMLADRFDLAGYRTVFLGADTPVDEIVTAASAVGADIVVMTVSTVFERVELRLLVDTMIQRLPGVSVRVGGPAFARGQGSWPAEALFDPAEFGLPGSAPAG
jgi:MerR family transcriptional regulator, light-induced transcriptional regulator